MTADEVIAMAQQAGYPHGGLIWNDQEQAFLMRFAALVAEAERDPLTHAQAKALVLKYGNDPLHLVYQVEVAHGIKEGGQHGAE